MEAAELLTVIRSGEIPLFRDILEVYQSPITRYLYRLTGEYETARDLSQDTFVKVLNNLDRIDADFNLNAWVYRIATNTALQYLRRKKIVGFISFEKLKISEPEGPVNDPVENITIREALQQIPQKQRICIVLYYVEGFKCREIAETLDISEAAVRKRIARGAALFRKLYNGGTE